MRVEYKHFILSIKITVGHGVQGTTKHFEINLESTPHP